MVIIRPTAGVSARYTFVPTQVENPSVTHKGWVEEGPLWTREGSGGRGIQVTAKIGFAKCAWSVVFKKKKLDRSNLT